MTRSILSSELKCYLCGSRRDLEEHHIFGAANRKKSEKYGLKVFLCHYCHNEPPMGVHHNKAISDQLKKVGQTAWMRTYDKTERDFVREFGKSYL